MGNHELWCISRFPISSSGLRNGGDGAFQGNRDIILQAPINSGIFNYLNLIKSPRSNYEVRIVVIIITTKEMFLLDPTNYCYKESIHASASLTFEKII